ncbi:DUF1905 domain-containing protein [Chishuiella sp.]|uniref:DUF1905 domain-containing protein n=1 Tax=Chishuiella sp. TaxID=1969467 RepID=UPI0028A68AC7|nr:DUF1905 domain-containing protein [Chishuiella sp.]
MEFLIKNQQLELKYEKDKGAWTYHIQIPNTKDIVGKWGSLKVSGTIDEYKIESINLFSRKGEDKLISINKKIRNEIKKDKGDFVNVTLYLLNPINKITEKEILQTFEESAVLLNFQNLSEEEKDKIIKDIISENSEEKQIKIILKYINILS